ncbi:hypothetical protein GCM10025298_33560 [Natronobiforma cellulositropha]
MLNEEWNRVRNDDEHDYLDDEFAASKIGEVLNASQLTYKYILVTNVIAKAVNPNIHYRAMQAQWVNPGAYNARSLGHQVLVEWEKEHGERLGGSNEPFLNKPARYPDFSMENSYRSEKAHTRLYELLERLEEQTNSGEVDPVDVLRHTVYEISQLDPQTVDFVPPKSEVPYEGLRSRVEEYLEKSGGGERLASVTAGVMKAHYTHTNGEDYTIAAEHANVPDEFSKAAGDVEVFRDEELVRAMEVKDKPTERSDIQHAITKARENELPEYLYIVGQGFRNESEKQGALKEIEDASVGLILVYPEELLSLLKFVEDAGRKQFVESVGEFLNDMRASAENKTDWKDLAESFG